MTIHKDETSAPTTAGDREPAVHHVATLRAADVIGDRTEIFALRPEHTVEAAARRLADWSVRTVAVIDEVGNVAGVLGQSDISSRVVAAGLDAKTVAVREAMTRQPVCVDVETDLVTCVRLMRRSNISHLVLTRTTAEGEQYFGMISANDVLGVIAGVGNDVTFWFTELAGQARA